MSRYAQERMDCIVGWGWVKWGGVRRGDEGWHGVNKLMGSRIGVIAI